MLLKLPEKINKIEILNCNNNCTSCDIAQRKNLTSEEIKKLIESGKKDNDILHFTNGEVAIRNDFIDLINFGRQLGYQIIQIETNGRIFYYPKFVEKIKNIGIDKFIINFYHFKPELHEQITRVPGSFKQTLIGIKNLIKNHKYTSIKLIINELNYKEIPEIVEFLANLKVNEINFEITDESEPLKAQIMEALKKAELICANYGILTNRINLPIEENEIELDYQDKEIGNKIKYLLDQKSKFIDFNLRKKIFGDIKLIEVLEYLRKKTRVIFHSSYDKFDKIIPHQGEAIYYHGNFNAVYAQDDPYQAILRALKNKKNKTLGFCTIIKDENGNNRFFAEKKISENFSNGYIYILNNNNFLYSRHEYYTFSSVIPILVFEVSKIDFPFEIEPFPFIETQRENLKIPFTNYERDLIREICLLNYQSFKFNKQHSFEHIYRVSEMAFNFALKECSEFANEIFIGACSHDIGRLNEDQDDGHGQDSASSAENLINKYFKQYYKMDVLEAIKTHPYRIISKNPIIGCIFDADRIDLLRQGIIPKPELLSTKSAKEMLKNMSNYHKNNFDLIFENWNLHLDYFRKFLNANQISLPNKFFKKLNKNNFKGLAIKINENYNDLGELLEVYKYIKHSCNKIHLFIFENKKVIVKFSERKKEEILFEDYLLNLLVKFVNLPKILKTNKNLPYLKYKNSLIILDEFINSSGINFDSLENDVIGLLKNAYNKRSEISKMYRKFLPKEFKNKKISALNKNDLEIIKEKEIRKYLKDARGLINKYYKQEKYFVPTFKGLQVVGNNGKNYFLGTEHLFELYIPINQAIANYLINVIFISKKSYSIKEVKDLIKKFLALLEIKDLYFNTKLVLLFIFVQYMYYLKNKKLEDKNLKQKWENLLPNIKEIYDLYQ